MNARPFATAFIDFKLWVLFRSLGVESQHFRATEDV